ncbi:biotin transporter BioY [Paenibacillus sp. Marseille-P2973]|uniref:biotin transporter BioY n=1 Tax=Paenibacillus TaxID=44249 RepID=UPI001B35E86D|nr:MULTISPECIES: biotin transporter BioY [Paenibacillus]MBQ4901469.1 biotin transporter BioY [Paenibacillus sp. Marseille-P2973]MDN4067835.1 biotin transporter BioY [Paenibacillus vini]
MKTKEIVYAALFTAFMAVLGMIPPIPLGFIPVPVTAQTLGVMLAGCFLGKKPAAMSLILFIVLVAIGLPILSGGRGGLAPLVGPSAGYIFSWPIAAFLIGYASEKIWPKLRMWKLLTINILFGVLLVSLIGAPVMALITHTSIWAGLIGSVVYLPGDIIKAVIAAVVAFQLRAISPIEEKAH